MVEYKWHIWKNIHCIEADNILYNNLDNKFLNL